MIERGPSFSEPFRKQLAELIAWRRDVRRFRRDPVEPETLERLLALANAAPSVGLSQPWRFVIVDSPTRRAAVRASFVQANAEALAAQPVARQANYAGLKLAGLDEAPVHLAVLVEPDPPQGHELGRRTMPDTVTWSAVLAIGTLWLAARAEGLGLGWVSILEPTAVTDALEVPAPWRLVAYLCLGTPDAAADRPELEMSGWEDRRPPNVLRR